MATHHLAASEITTKVGIIDNSFKPVLEINDGDEVVFEVLGSWNDGPQQGMSFDEISGLRSRYTHQGGGPHTLIGPVALVGAKAGMSLRVDILELKLSTHGYNLILPSERTRGLLAEHFQHGSIHHFTLDPETLQTELRPGFTIPLRPFLGIMGVAPYESGPHSSAHPGVFGGNIDCPELTIGASLYLPIWKEGGLFYAGDAHAAQGCGEVTQTALETSMPEAKLRFHLKPNLQLERPRIETPTALITMGFHEDLREAAKQATYDMVQWINQYTSLTPTEAYCLCSLQMNLYITQAVNGVNGVHAKISRELLDQAKR